MRKLFLKLSMLLFVLTMSVNAAWANLSVDGLPDQQLQQLMRPVYKAQMTGYTSSTGGGKVYVTLDENDPRCEDNSCWEEGTSNVALFGLGITTIESMPMTKGNFRCFAQKDYGYFFTGWSFSNLGTDLSNDADNVYICSVSTSMDSTEIAYYTIYGTFEPIRIADYAISDGNTTAKPAEERYCEQTVVFSLYGDHISAADFKAPTVTGTPGTWTVTSWDYGTTNSEKVTVNVKFVAPNDNVAEYSANLLLETQAGIKMNVPLAARTITPGDEALLYSKDNKTTPINQGTLTAMITAAGSTDVVKLNGNYASAVTIDKSLTLDLNGYTISNKLTVSGENVTIAYSKYGGTINGTTGTAIDLTGGTLTLNGGHITAPTIGVNIAAGATLNQNGATIEAASAILNNGTLVTTDGTAIGTSQCAVGASNGSTTTINGGSFFAGTSDAAVQIAGATAKAYIKKGTIASSTVAPDSQYGVSAMDGANVEIEKLAVINGSSYALKTDGGSILVKGGKFNSPSDFHYGTATDVTLNTAYFRNNSDLEEFKDKHLWRNTSGAEFREGYNYLAGEYSDAQAAGVSVCHIGATSYTTLEDALAFANTTNESLTIILDNDYKLHAGYYTLPSNATLLIPYKDENVSVAKIVERETRYETPYKFRKLTLSEGVNMDVHGTIEVGGVQSSTAGTNTGAPMGAYGQLQMNAGSRIVMQNGAALRAWGYVTGDIEHKNMTTHEVPMGEIDVRRGAKVYEMFEMGDWGSTISAGAGLMTNDSIFPLTHYFIQNVEVPAKYHPGAELTSVTSVTELGTITMCANDIRVIGVSDLENPSMFMMDEMADAENTWVRKWYNPVTDQQVYEVNSGAHIGQLVIPLVSSEVLSIVPQVPISGTTTVEDLLYSVAGVPKGTAFPTELVMNSGQYFLPLTTNFKIHVLTGTLDFTQSTELLPGCELEIDKEATVLITDEETEGVQAGSLFIYDYRDWGNFAYNANARKVSYSPVFGDVPSTRDISTAETLGSAKINVHGTFDTENGYVFTTEHGGNIFSSVEDAGTFKFTVAAKPLDYSEDIVQLQNGNRVTIHCYPAYLRNSDEFVTANGGDEGQYRYAKTRGTAAGKSYCYIDFDGNGGQWKSLTVDGCFTKDDTDPLHPVYYAKPQEYVALANGKTANDDHTYSDAAGAGRLFILMTDENGLDCQWWEVEAKENYFHCIHPDNDTYYEWDEHLYPIKNPDNPSEIIGYTPGWKEVRFEITWLDWNGDPILDANDNPIVYEVPYGTQAEWLSTNPTRESTIDYTYDFTGWSPALGKVTSDVTYMATYEEKQIKYTIVFVNDGGVEIERHLLARDEVPVCENVPTRTGYILQWEPGIEPVVGNQTYTATWLPEPPSQYSIIFKNYNGDTLQGGVPAYMVDAGTDPVYSGATPTKPATSEYSYTFSGWKPAITAASSNATYVAQFVEEPRQYTIKFYREDGTTPIETQYIPYGGEPVIPAYTKANTAQYTYSIAWKNKANNANIQSVTENADYMAVVTATTNKYNVKLISNPSGACTLAGNGIYEYGTEVTLAVDTVANYEFTGWSDGAQKGTHSENRYSRSIIVTSDTTIVANFTYKGEGTTYTIRWWNEDETPLVDPVVQQPNTNTIYPGATPTKDATAQYTFTFDGWATVVNGARVYKKGMTPKATANADYYAHFDTTVNTYEVALTASPVGAATFSGLGTYLYNENADAVTLTVIPNAGYTFTGWSDGQEGTNLVRHMAITDNIDLVANFEVNEPDYTIIWKSEDGSQDLAAVGYKYKTQSTYTGETPTKDATAEYSYTFDGWTTSANGEGTYYANGATPKVMADATYYAHFDRIAQASTTEMDVTEDKTINEDVEVSTTTIYVEGTLNVTSGKTLTTDILVIEADPSNSGQIIGAGTVDAGNVYFDLTRGAGHVFKHHTWYAFSVPFIVDASQILFDGETMQYGQTEKQDDYDVLYYDGSIRASSGKDASCWQYVEKTTPTYLYPGTLYMIANTRRDVTKLRFTKAAGALLTTSVSVEAHNAEDNSDANWNGIANPALFHADLSAVGAAENIAWVYNPDYSDPTNAYIKINDLSARDLILGEAIFVQTATGGTIEVTPAAPSPVVRRRVQASDSDNARYQVKIAKADGSATDDVIIRTDEEKAEDAYILGTDLVRMGMSSINPQLWINRYDEKLCVNVVKPINNEANYPLGIFAPADGEYSIFTEAEPNEHTALYLTFDGQVIWNLSESAYMATLKKGTNSRYGLRIRAKAPQTATAMDEAVVDAQGEIKKVLINNQVFIIRGNNVYSVDGQLVK